ncbi:MAG: sigma-70 family RNA polymerase sigma factor [Treponema sp.]|nr:sigma-70 family RNA polymerase sigma factor [Treponema sp.]
MKNKITEAEALLLLQKDRILVRRTLRGNADAFSTLVANNKKRIEAVGRRFFNDITDIEDFVQEVFIKAYKNLSSFKGKSLFSTWITRIAFTTAINQKKSFKITDSFDEQGDFLPSPYDNPENEQIKALTKEAINEAVQDLPENYAVCIKMFFYLDMNQEDISEMTGIPLNTVKSNIFRAKKILSEKLGGLL